VTIAGSLRTALFILLAWGAGIAHAAGGFTDVDAVEVRRLVGEGVTVVDVRRADEWRSTGVIEGSTLITAFDASGRFNPEFPAAIAAAARPDQPVLVICWTGNRSKVIAEALAEQAGYSRVFNAVGGMQEWLRAGGPVGDCRSC